MSAPGTVRRAAVTRDNWETPPELFELLDAESRFELDAAATIDNRKCAKFLGPGSAFPDAFAWDGSVEGAIWCNPPYGKGLEQWVRMFADWAEEGRCASVDALLPDAMDTEWFAELERTASEVRILSGRVQFVGTTSSNPSGSIVAKWRRGVRKAPAPHIWLWRWRDDLAQLRGAQ